ncbi:telomere length regulation protein TEL2 homolog [Vigna unguiculata]|uniref:telomere length regulation protein TEL2 homolog n=1 Tax=Vigna unguiculata TaxID=3917 RepID=UPI0010172207|nr:telomere length regulation protein TEL2 homolog [Vigna unguiculata]XP_027903300.1 telomere length regulation protein TEL2 homolog [Vigna unguiculata]
MEEVSEKKELEHEVVTNVAKVISAIKNAKHVDQVICALHSIATMFFPVDLSLLSDCIDESYRDQVFSVEVPTAEKRNGWWRAFYRGAAFPTLARFLLLDVASNWLGCFPFSAQKCVYDVFFVRGLVSEVLQILVPFLQLSPVDGLDVNAVLSNSERLLVLCLLENKGVVQLAREFGGSSKLRNVTDVHTKMDVSRVAQIVASIPDKARMNSSTSLSSHVFFKQVVVQLLSLAEKREMVLLENAEMDEMDKNGAMFFVGEMFSRICRRGSTDLLSSELIPEVVRLVNGCLSSNNDSITKELLALKPDMVFWSRIMESISDPYTKERISELILHKLATQDANDVQAYWLLWLLFHRIFKLQASVRSMFVDKFLLWKVFPVSCLKWILQFAVHECPPGSSLSEHNRAGLLNTVQRLMAVWSKKEFVQTAPIEQQAYISAALGLSLETMSREELDGMKNGMHLILQGVSCRLESPNHLVRKMASCVALALSIIIDPKNPLYLDDSYSGEAIDWEFGFTILKKGNLAAANCGGKGIEETKTSTVSGPERNTNSPSNKGKSINVKGKKKLLEFNVLDPDEIIDPASLNHDSDDNEEDVDDSASENSYSSSDSSLQPYDLEDDDSDLKRKFSQLAEVIAALRKSDDAEGVETAIDVAEKLIRASPDELKHAATDLTRTLVQVRCSDIALEGAEESTEDKRQRALVALAVTCPFESLETLNKLLYSPNVDISQRIMMLDVMTEAAQELAESKIMKPKHQTSSLISVVSDTRPWFLPSSTGTPGAGSWKEISGAGSLLNWSNSYERDLPPKHNQVKKGKTRRWSLRSAAQKNQMEYSHNKFPLYAASFMLPAMEGYDKKRHGVDLLGRDFIVLGKLIYMLGVCMKSVAMHPEASVLAPLLLNMLRSREVCHHQEAYVRRAVLFAASCVLVALHPTYISSALLEGNVEISTGLEWIRTWALDIAELDTDKECYTMAMTCLQLHAEMALQTSRALESARSSLKAGPALTSGTSNVTIKIPYLNGD